MIAYTAAERAEIDRVRGLIETAGIEIPDPQRLLGLPIPVRAAMGELMMEPLRQDLSRRRKRQGIGARSGERPIRAADAVASLLGVGATTVGRAGAIRKADPEVFEQLLAGEIDTVEDGLRLADVAGFRQRRREHSEEEHFGRHAFVGHLRPLNIYLKHWSEASFSGMTPAEARRLLPMVQATHFALIEVERALEQRAIRSRALR